MFVLREKYHESRDLYCTASVVCLFERCVLEYGNSRLYSDAFKTELYVYHYFAVCSFQSFVYPSRIYIKMVKVKVKLSLCLTKHHAMKTYWGVEV